MDYHITVKKDGELHIYFPNKGGVYVDKSEGTYDWMCSINKDKSKFTWNDHFVPTLDDMEYVLHHFNNFDEVYCMAPEDTFLTEDDLLELSENNVS